MQIIIVGAGVAGLQTASELARRGHRVRIFEKSAGVGGVWRSNYDGFGLQVPAYLYEFPEFPNRTTPPRSFPEGDKVLAYVHDYAKHHALWSRCHVHLSEGVHRIQRLVRGWMVHTAQGEYTCDFIVMATGMYHSPHIPDAFANRTNVVHSSSFVNASQASNRRVVVVGAGKSAVDCATKAHAVAKSVTVLARRLHWPVPRLLANVIPFEWTTYSRLGSLLLPVYWLTDRTTASWHRFFEPLKMRVWRAVEHLITMQYGLATRPPEPLLVDLFSGGQIHDGAFQALVRRGEVAVTNDAAVIEDAELIVCATGFRKTYDLFDESVRRALNPLSDGLWLHRNILPPDVPGLAFVGAEVSTFNNILTHHLQARWLADILEKGAPSTETMTQSVERERRWKRSWMPESPDRAALVQLHMTQYHDALLSDMGLARPKRKWYQVFAPLTARDYAPKT